MAISIIKGHIKFIPCSLHNDCKIVQKFVFTNVNRQRNTSPYLQMFAFSFFDGSHICRCLSIFCSSDVPQHNSCSSKNNVISLTIIKLYLQTLDSASENRFCERTVFQRSRVPST